MRPSSIVFGVFAALTLALGYSFEQSDSLSWVAGNPLLAVAGCVVFAVLGTVAAETLFRLLERRIDKEQSTGRFSAMVEGWMAKQSAKRLFFAYWGIVAVAWIPWFVSMWPGTTDFDTMFQILEYCGLAPATDHHPWLDTLLYGAFWDLGQAVSIPLAWMWLYCIVQGLIAAAGIAMLLSFCARWGVKPVVRMVLLVIFALYPPFPQLAMYIVKDSTSAVLWVPWLVLFADAIMLEWRSLPRPLAFVAFMAITVLLVLTKKTSLFIVVPSLVIAALVCPKPRKALLASGAVLLVALFAWSSLALPAMGVGPGDAEREMMSIPAQQVARYARTYDVSEREKQAIDAVFSGGSDALAQSYVPNRADATKRKWRIDSTFEEKLDFLGAYFSMFAAHPGVFLSAAWNTSYGYFYPGTELIVGLGPTVTDNSITSWAKGSFDWVSEDDVRAFFADEAREYQRLHGDPPVLHSAYGSVCRLPFVGIPFSIAFVCSWLPLFVLMYALRNKLGKLVVFLVPSALVLLSISLGPIVLVRYAAAATYGAMVFIALLFTDQPFLRLHED